MDGCSIDANFQSSSEILSVVGENPNHLITYNFPKRVLFSKTSMLVCTHWNYPYPTRSPSRHQTFSHTWRKGH